MRDSTFAGKVHIVPILILASLLLLVSGRLEADPVSRGPLRGKLLDAPHQIYYSFPGFSARDGASDGLRVYGKGYYSNEFRGYAFDPDEENFDGDGRLSDENRADELSAMDFESLVLEFGGSMPFGADHRIGAALRVYAYYGGFLDPVIEYFHGAFGLANASREYFPQGSTSINVKNDRGVEIVLGGPDLLFGDTEVYGVWTVCEGARSAWAIAWAVELPTGKAGTPAGNGYVDFGLQLLYERVLTRGFVLHLQQGLVVPGEILFPGAKAEPLPISQSLAAIEWMTAGGWSLFLQTRIHTSPLTSSEPLSHSLFRGVDQFEMPVTSLQFGLRRDFGGWLLQGCLEEDALTHEGPDFVLSLGVECWL
jgi:Protein of unknown function (DUF3187)